MAAENNNNTLGLEKLALDDNAPNIPRARRRLSLTGDTSSKPEEQASLDGQSTSAKDTASNEQTVSSSAPAGSVVSAYASEAHVGFVPFNAGKVNQDRATMTVSFRGNEDEFFFSVMDGHGQRGHEVSEYCSKRLPQIVEKLGAGKLDDAVSDDATEEVSALLQRSFEQCHSDLQGVVDCRLSGTTVIACYLKGNALYTCNAGDSRAVLAKARKGKDSLVAVGLSDDQKPEVPSERDRIIASGGRVEACRLYTGEPVGPQRVWLKTQDAPGLAMTRSFGDLVAQSVGVIPTPEVRKRFIDSDDRFVILASDGVWEFISNQEAVDIVAAAKSPEAACHALYEESTRRWKAEEEVIDDISCLVVYFAA